MKDNALRLTFGRLAARVGVPRLHIQLLRHTFVTGYLLDGGDHLSTAYPGLLYLGDDPVIWTRSLWSGW